MLIIDDDPDDYMVLRTAIAGKADMLVTNKVGDFGETVALSGGTPDRW